MFKPSASTISAGLIGLTAGTLAFGAVHIALGKDLAASTTSSKQSVEVQQHVNRDTKSDRLAVAAAPRPGTTLSFRIPSMADTLIVTRMPPKVDAPTPQQEGNAARRSSTKRVVACEPSVSVLTEVAKLLEPSRCIT